MRFIQPVVDAQAARQRLERQRFKRLRRWTGAILRAVSPRSLTAKGAGRPGEFRRPLPYMEVTWLPYYRVVIETSSKGTPRQVDVLVAGCDGQFALTDLSGLAFEAREDGEPFAPSIDETRAVQVARTALVSAILRSPGWGSKPAVGRTRHAELMQYPFWVYTFERRPGRLDIKVLDAVTGKLPGPKTKASILQMFVSAREGTCHSQTGASG